MVKRHILLIVGLLGIMGTLAWTDDEFKPSVDFKGSRIATGYLDSGRQGSYPHASFQMPDAKLRFNWQMDKDITVVTRMSLQNALFNNLDYFYIEYRNLFTLMSPSLSDKNFNPVIRLGRIKLDIGEETWSDNPVESVVVSNSAGITSGYDEGLQLSQNLPKESLGVPVKWSLSLTNGNAGTGPDNNQEKATCVKLGVNPVTELYISGSYYSSGNLENQDAEVKYAGLASRPTNASQWNRTLQELDLRYDFQPGKENRLNPGAPAFSDSKAFVRLAYGQLTDHGSDPIMTVMDRKGSYYYLDGCYNATEKVYLAARYSQIAFNDSTVFASLNGINANQYTRTSLGVGYRLKDNTHVKLEYATNTVKIPTGATTPDINQVAVLLTTKF